MHCNLVRVLGLAALALALGSARADESPAPAAPAADAADAQALAAASAPAPPQQHCWREYRVGSNFPVTRCDTEESEAERQRRLGEWHNSLTRANQTAKAPGSP